MEISFIGGGVMAEAIIAGILRQGIAQPREICAGEPLQVRREHLAKQHGIAVTSDNVDAAHHGELVVLAVKPQSLSEVAQQLTGALREDQTAISIIAGAKMENAGRGAGASERDPGHAKHAVPHWRRHESLDGFGIGWGIAQRSGAHHPANAG